LILNAVPRPGGHSKKENVQLLLCADFNSLPQSGVIEFINNGKVAVNHPEFKGKFVKLLIKLNH
jgi:mRNA deadenylase 3'-5' endonuclease subunit Ccr4